ncbi:hypothetical protein Btru_065647 [Bulinus truncatus]|nr:hypothetical protein Btru_065647 [Bulinus truncatus]
MKGVEVLQSEIEKAKDKLRNYNENIKKLTGRDPNRPGAKRLLSNDGVEREEDGYSGRTARGRGRLFGLARRSIMEDNGPPSKRRVVGGAFSRLGPAPMPARRRDREDSPYEEELPTKLSVHSSVVSTSRDAKSRQEIMQEQTKDKDGMQRNKRMFGLLLGTLNKFKTESKTLETKEVQRKKIEKKLEEIAEKEKKKFKLETKLLLEEMHLEQSKISRLEQKMEMVQEHADRAKEIEKLKNFIATKTKPRIFWKPVQSSSQIENKLKESKKVVDEMLQEGQDRLEKEIKELMEREYKREERIKMRLREDGLFGDDETGVVEDGGTKDLSEGAAVGAVSREHELNSDKLHVEQEMHSPESGNELKSKPRRTVVLESEKDDKSDADSEGERSVDVRDKGKENKVREDMSRMKSKIHDDDSDSVSEREESKGRSVKVEMRVSGVREVKRTVESEGSHNRGKEKQPVKERDQEVGEKGAREKKLEVKIERRHDSSAERESERWEKERSKKESVKEKSKPDSRREDRKGGHQTDKKHAKQRSRDSDSSSDSDTDSKEVLRNVKDRRAKRSRDEHRGHSGERTVKVDKSKARADRGDVDMESDDDSKH